MRLQRLLQSPSRCASGLLAGFALAAPAIAAPLPFAPLIPGHFDPGGGADAAFYKVDNAWHGSTVLWDEATRTFGSGLPIGSFPWGSGLWGRPDWDMAQAAGAAGAAPVQAAWSGTSAAINYANLRYNACHSTTWGPATPMPLPQSDAGSDPDCSNAEGADPSQDNWTARFSGYIRITDADDYNFSVLNDDGFFLRLLGAGGAALEIGRDFLNPRERNGFGEFLALTPGLYGFELGMWNRRGAGVVDLRWLQGQGDREWDLVPVTNLVGAGIPAPSSGALLLAALALLGPRRQRAAAA